MRSRTSAGTPDDPINLGVEGARAAILAAFQKSGWVPADPLSPRNDARLALDVVLHRSYPRAPVSRLYLFGRPEDLAVEHELGAVSRRDHARFWDTHRRDPRTHLELWIGDASRDTGVEVALSHSIPVGTTHHISPFVDAERRRIVATLRRAGVVAAVVMEPGIGPTLLGHNGAGDPFVTDGRAAVIVLTQPYPPRVTPVPGRQVDVGERQPTESQARRLETWRRRSAPEGRVPGARPVQGHVPAILGGCDAPILVLVRPTRRIPMTDHTLRDPHPDAAAWGRPAHDEPRWPPSPCTGSCPSGSPSDPPGSSRPWNWPCWRPSPSSRPTGGSMSRPGSGSGP